MADKNSIVIKLLVGLMSFLGAVVIAGTPWAYMMGTGQASLNVKMNNVLQEVKKIDGIEDRLTKIETEVRMLHTQDQ